MLQSFRSRAAGTAAQIGYPCDVQSRPEPRQGRRLDLIAAAIAGAALVLAVQLYGSDVFAQFEPKKPVTGLEEPQGTRGVFADVPWAASNGFMTVPSARALANRPRWDVEVAAAALDPDVGLAIIGLPVDFDHAMLQRNASDTYCVARQSVSEQSVALCGKRSAQYTLVRQGPEYTICRFTDDCWHSTAAAVLASGGTIDRQLFSLETMAAVAYQEGSNEMVPDPAQAASSRDSSAPDMSRVNFPATPHLYKSGADMQSRMVDAYERDDGADRLKEEIARRRPYTALPGSAFPLVEVYRNEPAWHGGPSIAALVNRNMLLQTGRRPGGPIYAINVFSRVDDGQLCKRADREAPCVLTNLAAQERALAFVLDKVKAERTSAPAGRPRIGAVLIVAGGALTGSACDNTPTARHIKELRELGVFTFVPAGNDGVASRVRFPACVSESAVVGALDRDGKIGAFSNGHSTRLVKLYTDGDALVLPIRGRPIPGVGCMTPEGMSEIVKPYQQTLAKLRHLSGEPSGKLDRATEAAVRRYQVAIGLAASGKLDMATLAALDDEAAELRRQAARAQGYPVDDAWYEKKTIVSNLRAAGMTELADYRAYLCPNREDRPYYQAQFVGGTLAGAAIVAGQFLQLLDRHRDRTTTEVYQAMTTVAARNAAREVDVRAVDEYLRTAPRQPARQ
jgi:hypothetical protein